MTKADQKRIIREMTATVRKRMLDNAGKLPKNWDGIELRQWFADIVREDINYWTMDRTRRQNYVNDVAINNL